IVSGLVTSPCDQLRIFSGDARLMRIASKSAIGFAMSKGLERYKVFLRFLLSAAVPNTRQAVSSSTASHVPRNSRALGLRRTLLKVLIFLISSAASTLRRHQTGYPVLATINPQRPRPRVFSLWP